MGEAGLERGGMTCTSVTTQPPALQFTWGPGCLGDRVPMPLAPGQIVAAKGTLEEKSLPALLKPSV